MIRIVFKRCLLALLSLSVLFCTLQAQASLGQKKRVVVWGREISYHFIPINNERVRYDGTAYVSIDKKNGNRENRLVLNSAFFAKEAEQIFDDFEKQPDPSIGLQVDLEKFIAVLSDAERRLKEGDGLSGDQRKMLVAYLEDLEHQLQDAAWYGVYKKSQNKNDFVRTFTNIRSATIEYHELSNLRDEIEWAELASGNSPALKRDDALFWNQTEVRAFLTEMAYGLNPRDSIFQAVTGGIQEIKGGKNMDFSIQKLNSVLKIARNLPMGGNGFACLCFLTVEHARAIAVQVYHKDALALSLAAVKPAA